MRNLPKEEKEALTKIWKANRSKDYVLTKEHVQDLFEYLAKQIESVGCDHTLRHTKHWLAEHIPHELTERVTTEITDMGGYCDCEVLLNCYEEYDIE